MTMTDPYPSVQGHSIFEVEYQKLRFRDKVSIEH